MEFFEWMIAPVSSEEFYDGFYETKPICVHRKMPKYYTQWFSKEEVKKECKKFQVWLFYLKKVGENHFRDTSSLWKECGSAVFWRKDKLPKWRKNEICWSQKNPKLKTFYSLGEWFFMNQSIFFLEENSDFLATVTCTTIFGFVMENGFSFGRVLGDWVWLCGTFFFSRNSR